MSIDDNDIADLRTGMYLGASQTLDTDLFDVVARNSLHGNVAGLFVSAAWDADEQGSIPSVPRGNVAAALYSFGEVFRDDAVSGTAGTGFEVVGNLLFAPPQVATEVALPVFDRCTVAGARFAFSFEASELRAGTSQYDPGIADVALVGCVVTGPGTVGSAAVVRSANGTRFHGISPESDQDLFGNDATGDQWQNVADDYAGL